MCLSKNLDSTLEIKAIMLMLTLPVQWIFSFFFYFVAHIIFDNAIITDGVTKSENGFVEQFREVMKHVFPEKYASFCRTVD